MKILFYVNYFFTRPCISLFSISSFLLLNTCYAMKMQKGEPLSFTLLKQQCISSDFEKVIKKGEPLSSFSCYQSIHKNPLLANDITYCIRNTYNRYATLLKLIITDDKGNHISHIKSGMYTDNNTTPNDNRWEIEYLYTSDLLREKGYATFLLQETEQWLKKVQVTQLHLIAHQDLINWYKKRGFNLYINTRIGKESYLLYKNL